jgi:AcrR family transcriptional regulator
LNRELILEAALGIIDQDGLASLNMRRLATEVDAAPMSLYRYFENKNEILDGVVEVILRDLESPLGQENWTRSSEVLFWSLRGALCAHPNALPLFASRHLDTWGSRRHAEDLVEVYRASGFDDREASHLLSTLIGFTVGHVWILAGGFVGEPPEDEVFARSAARVDSGGASDPASSAGPGLSDAEERFASGLRMILDRPTVANPPAASPWADEGGLVE